METEYICTRCGRIYPADSFAITCRCGGLLDLRYSIRPDQSRIEKNIYTLWRYRQFLPLPPDILPVSLGEGLTPIIEVTLGGKRIRVKQEQIFPTGSYKDRGSTVLISFLKSLGVSGVIEDSSGNAGASIAAYCAHAGIHCRIFVPEHTSEAKLQQIQAYKAALERIPGDRDATASAALKEAAATVFASHVYNPLFFHGTKTFIYEIWEQSGFHLPDYIVMPVGNGTLMMGSYLAVKELLAAGKIEKAPRLIGVQAALCDPLSRAIHRNSDRPMEISSGPTMAEGIAIGHPARGRQILKAVRDTGGTILSVTEDEIEAALQAVFDQGFYIEPTSAASPAGVVQLLSTGVDPSSVVTLFSGHGLKYHASNHCTAVNPDQQAKKGAF